MKIALMCYQSLDNIKRLGSVAFWDERVVIFCFRMVNEAESLLSHEAINIWSCTRYGKIRFGPT